MSFEQMYADYIKTRSDMRLYCTEHGFATYRKQGNALYIIDLYTDPKLRHKRIATEIADKVCEIGKQMGCTKLMGTVDLMQKGSYGSVGSLHYYGMTAVRAEEDVIYFEKEF